MVTASPVARRMAEEHNIDLALVKPAGGRVEKADVLAFIDQQTAKAHSPQTINQTVAARLIPAPGKKPGVSPRLVELVDLFPTLVELCGLPTPDGLEGLSFVPLLDRPTEPWKKAAFTVVSHAGKVKGGAELDPTKLGRTVRTEHWRYTEWFDGSAELYDHDADPHEFANLANSPNHTGTLAELKGILAEGWKAALP